MFELPRIIKPKAPPIKIQGIKTKLVPFIAGSVLWDGRGRWVEPFAGSCSVVLNVAPRRALIADTNRHLINFYRGVQEGSITPGIVRDFLEHEGAKLMAKGEEHYYAIRERFNKEASPLDLIFLNRSCFNGIMRFNKKGGFNVPFCRKPERFRQALITKICNQVAWAADTIAGKDWEFKVQPWEATLMEIGVDDFVYLDPPYIGRHADYYNQWSEEHAKSLAASVRKLRSGFAYSMWKENKYRENAHLEEEFKGYAIETFNHFYHVGASENLRSEMEEALVLNPISVVPQDKRITSVIVAPVSEQQKELDL